jgi:hypothetical protein
MLPVLILLVIFGVPAYTVVTILKTTAANKLRHKELEVRELEARARLLTAPADAPDWLDTSDADAVTEWRKARREIDQLEVRRAL